MEKCVTSHVTLQEKNKLPKYLWISYAHVAYFTHTDC